MKTEREDSAIELEQKLAKLEINQIKLNIEPLKKRIKFFGENEETEQQGLATIKEVSTEEDK